MQAFLAGVVAGYGIAVPVGAVGAYLVALSARASFRVGGAAALGVAAADGVYATVAVVGGAALAGAVESVAEPLRWLAFVVLLGLAVRMAYVGVREYLHPHLAGPGRPVVTSPARAFVTLLGTTLLNPATVVYFAALVLGRQYDADPDALTGVLFVAGAFLASASWQLLLAGGGAALGRAVTGPKGRLATALLSAVLIAALAVWTVAG